MRTLGYFSAKRWPIPASRHQAQVIIMPVVRGIYLFAPDIEGVTAGPPRGAGRRARCGPRFLLGDEGGGLSTLI